jgi:dihydroflavonol-4-reductase
LLFDSDSFFVFQGVFGGFFSEKFGFTPKTLYLAPMKIAVTGATGHIGVNLIPELINKGHHVRALIHHSTDHFQGDNIEFFHGEILDRESVEKFVNGSDVVIHLAAVISIKKRSPEALKVNIEGTKNVIESALRSGIKRLIHFSSIHSLKSHPLDKVLDETRQLNLDSPFDYDRSKAEGERLAMEAAGKDMSVIVLNPTAVIGPNDYRPSFLGRAILRFAQGRIPALVEGGYDWVDVRDVVGATLNAISSSTTGGKYMLSGLWKSMKELSGVINDCGGAKPPSFTVPFPLAMAGAGLLNLASTRKGEAQIFTPVSLVSLKHGHKHISHNKATMELGFSPRPFEETIADTLDWFRKNNYI